MDFLICFLFVLALLILTVCVIAKIKENIANKQGITYEANFDYDSDGYNRMGYNIDGMDKNGKYNRYYDIRAFQTSMCSNDGFLNPRSHPIGVTDHASMRIRERMGNLDYAQIQKLAKDAYCYGKSARQVSKNTAIDFYELERKHDGNTVLLYKNYLYIFSEDNSLITMYKNDRNFH